MYSHKVLTLSLLMIFFMVFSINSVAAKSLPPIDVELYFNGTVQKNNPVNLTMNAKAWSDLPNTTLTIILPEGFELVSGNLSKRVNISKHESSSLIVTVKAIKTGNWTIHGRAQSIQYNGRYVTGNGKSLHIQVYENYTIIKEDELKTTNLPKKSKNETISSLKLQSTSRGNSNNVNYKTSDDLATLTNNVIIEGYWSYYDQTDSKDNPLRYIPVELWSGISLFPLAVTRTDEDGFYRFDKDFNGNPLIGPMDFDIKIYTDSEGVKVTDGNIFGLAYWSTTGLNHVNDYILLNHTMIENKTGAIAIYDAIMAGHNYAKIFGYIPSKVTVYWYDNYVPPSHMTHYNHIKKAIHISGANSDRDQWDEDVILHEYGHFIMDSVYGEMIPDAFGCHRWDEGTGACAFYDSGICGVGTCEHFRTEEEAKRLAFSEGWATFFQGAVQNDYEFSDYTDGWIGIHHLELEFFLPQSADIEGAVAQTLWDIFDSTDDGNDTLSLGFTNIWDVFSHYTTGGHNSYTIDDFWDGWFNRGHNYWAQMAAIFEDHGIDKCPDSDGDGYDNHLCGGTDCDDSDPGIHPGASESCNGRDDDCDGQIDDIDQDGDGYRPISCGGTDCDDANPNIHPGADEVCDLVDNNCDGQIDEVCVYCDQTITKSTTLITDVTGCATNGINIGADNIILDCNGHVINGSGVFDTSGISNGRPDLFPLEIILGFDNVTIRNCIIENFNTGVTLWYASNTKIKGNSISKSNMGIYIQSSDGNILEKNSISKNSDGISIYNSDNNIIVNNNISSNAYNGIFVLTFFEPDKHSENNNFSYNDIYNNGHYSFKNEDSYDMMAEYNWWGTTNEYQISNKIYDHNDDNTYGLVDYIPWLNEPVFLKIICFDGIQNGDETDIDCGGSCSPCSDGKNCLINSDCQSNYCDSNHICSLPGDVNRDCTVNIFDLAAVGLAFGSEPGDSNWDPDADIYPSGGDGSINIFDLAMVGLNYGGTC